MSEIPLSTTKTKIMRATSRSIIIDLGQKCYLLGSSCLRVHSVKQGQVDQVYSNQNLGATVPSPLKWIDMPKSGISLEVSLHSALIRHYTVFLNLCLMTSMLSSFRSFRDGS